MSVTARFSASVLLLLLAACGEQAQKPPAPPPPQVTVAKPVKQTVVDQDEYVGRFVAVDLVEIRARVSGYLEKVHFTDGQMVKAGDLLFSIDPRPYRNVLAQARGTLAQSRANLEYTTGDLERAKKLVQEKTISEQVFEQRTQAMRTAQALVSANEAAVNQAALDLEFTELRAPVSGRIGDRKVAPGNLVTGALTGTTTLLATIVSTDPIRFEFTTDEGSYLRYQRMPKNAPDIADRGAGLEVALKLLDESDFGHKGKMDFVDNVIDRSSGTIRARAQFGNPTSLFTPGMFARIRVPGSAPYEALLVPDVAIGTEQVRKFVWVIDGENTAKQKYVTLGSLQGGLRIVKEGVSIDDRVVVNGLNRVRANQKVTPQEQGAAPPAGTVPAAPATAKN
jgi:multidrug efflux system membrane fusion protein